MMSEMVKSRSSPAHATAQANGHTNGVSTGRFIDGIDPDDPEYQRRLQRPAEIKEDVKLMEHRQRVSFLLKSQAFRDELDEIVKQQLIEGAPVGANPDAFVALQQLTDLLAPHGSVNKHSTGGMSGFLGAMGPIIQINDLRGPEHSQMSKLEKLVRCKLASLYRVIDLFGWTQNIYNHITARLSPDQEHFFINPFGLLYSEITASSLVKVDVRGDILDPGCTTFGVNRAGFVLHSALHAARPDIRCIIHLHTPSIVAVSIMKCGLLPLCQEAAILGPVSYHPYCGILVDDAERYSLAKDLGPSNKVMFLQNHGVAICGESIEEAFFLAAHVVLACDTQIRLVPLGLDNLVQISAEASQRTFETASLGAGGVAEGSTRGKNGEHGIKWRRGELEFTAMMRLLDNSGYRTGYLYRTALVRDAQPSSGATNGSAEVAIPPTATAATLRFAEEEYAAQHYSPARQSLANQSKTAFSKWLTSPNVYQKVEQEEIGTPHPKKITHWVTEAGAGDGAMTMSTPIKIESPHQFAPVPGQGVVVSTKELRDKHKKIRQDYYADRTTAGPQSKLLEGTTWEEAQRLLQNQNDMDVAATQHVLVGAASKGIIQREFQHNAVVYKSYYAPNPFEKMTDQELATYQQQVTSGGTPSNPASPQPPQPQSPVKSPQPDSTDHQLIVTETVTEVPVKGERVTVTQTTVAHIAEEEGKGDGKEKKKKKFRIPSFSSGRKKDKRDPASPKDTMV